MNPTKDTTDPTVDSEAKQRNNSEAKGQEVVCNALDTCSMGRNAFNCLFGFKNRLALCCSATPWRFAPWRYVSQVLKPNLQVQLLTLHYITLHYITLHYITLHYITLHYITLHYITLHYITLLLLLLLPLLTLVPLLLRGVWSFGKSHASHVLGPSTSHEVFLPPGPSWTPSRVSKACSTKSREKGTSSQK